MNDSANPTGEEHLAKAAAQAAANAAADTLRDAAQPHLPDYELGECIGRGGMGAVFRARKSNLDRAVAIKILLPPPSEDVEGWEERFRQEARALARLKHPGIVTLHDYGQSDELAWLVLELVEGVNLRTLLDDGKLSPAEALTIVPPICEALQYAHDNGIVHRDVKPENVLLDLEGRVRLVDFGLAKITATDTSRLTRTGQAMGTPRYMAPEQLERPLDVDHRADIFSLGMVFYEMLTGQVPAGVVEPPSRKIGGDVRLDDVVLRALQREPAQRYQSAAEFQTGVGDVSTDTDSAARHSALPAGKVVCGWTVADGLACLALPIALFVVALTQAFYEPVEQAGALWALLTPFAAIGVLWWSLPVVTTVHWFISKRCKRAIPPSMPLVRVAIAATTLLGTALVFDHAQGIANAEYGRMGRVILGNLLNVLATVSCIAGLFGAWSRRGAHRQLAPPDVTALLLRGAMAIALVPVMIGSLASFSDVVLFGSLSSIHRDGLPFAAQLPTILGAGAALTALRKKHQRPAAMLFAKGVTASLLIHLIGRISYGEWHAAAFGCLFASALLAACTVAASAKPLPLGNSSS